MGIKILFFDAVQLRAEGEYHLFFTQYWSTSTERLPLNKHFGLKCRKIPCARQDREERYRAQQFCRKERNISVPPTLMTEPVKVDLL